MGGDDVRPPFEQKPDTAATIPGRSAQSISKRAV